MNKIEFDRNHALKAIERTKKHGVQWLYKNYPKYGGKMKKSTTGFLHHEGRIYPVKPLGRLAYEIKTKEPLTISLHTDKFSKKFKDLEFQLIEPKKEADRQRRLAETWCRKGQAKFRREVLEYCGSACLISGCETLEVIEAAHIVPVSEGGYDVAGNGLPLRADLHRLFDAGLLRIDPKTWEVKIDISAGKDYAAFRDMNISRRMKGVENIKALTEALRERICLRIP